MSTLKLENIKHENSSSNNLVLDSDGSVTINGNVGIGTDSPSEKLHVHSGTGNVPALFQSADPLSLITFKDNNTNTDVGIGGNSNDLVFYAGSERMKITSSGNLMLDPNSAGNKYLRLGTSSAGDGHILLDRAGSHKWQITSGTTNALQFYNYTAGSESMRIDASGYVTTPNHPHACWRSQNSTNGNYRLPKSHQHLNTGNNLSSTGRYTCPVAGTYHFSASGFTNYNSGYGYLNLKLNGNSVHDVHWNHAPMGIGHTAISGQITLSLSSGDYLETWQNTGSGAWVQDCISSVIFLG